MNNYIKILCPGQKCSKCLRMIARVEEALKASQTAANIEIIDSIDKLTEYNTWILPTLVINENIIARGYIPSVKHIQKHIKI